MQNPVANGIDVLQRREFLPLHGSSVGLITNHTGLNREGVATADLLRHAPGVQLLALFGPEHGIRGALDEKVPDGIDPGTGLPVFSLYGERTRPTSEQLQNLHTLVFDIQDIGTRFYTYISTLLGCMETAAEHHLDFMVLDRPNPIGGLEIEGSLADLDTLSFIACHNLPIRHGMTTGEMAKLFRTEKKLNLNLEIVPVEGWQRGDLWDATNLTWVNPSPNMRSLTQAFLYPGIGLLETTNLSVGRGTDTPFEIIGAPWLEGRRLAQELNERDLPGVRFVPVRFTPKSSTHAGKVCGGVQIIIVARHRFVPVYTGLVIAEMLRSLYPKDWNPERYHLLLANKEDYQAFMAGSSAETLVKGWQKQIAAFRKRRQPHLLYG